MILGTWGVITMVPRTWITLWVILHTLCICGSLSLCISHVIEETDLDVSSKISDVFSIGIGQYLLLSTLGSFSVKESWVLQVGKQGRCLRESPLVNPVLHSYFKAACECGVQLAEFREHVFKYLMGWIQ